MTTVQRWSGIEVRALREAKRMSLRDFAAHLGVSERVISKWEAGRDAIHPRPLNQAALDTVLARCDPDTRARFVHLVGESLVPAAEAPPEIIGDSLIRHPMDGTPMVPVDGSVLLSGPSNDPVWLPSFYIDVHTVSNADYARFVRLARCTTEGNPASSCWGTSPWPYIRQEQLDAAAVTLHEAIDVLEASRGGGGLNVVFSAGRELRPWRHEPSVQDAYDRLLALMSAA